MTDMRLTRLTVNLTPKAAESLQAASERDQLSRTDTVNRALQLYDLLTEHIAAGGKVVLRDPDGEMRWMEML